MQTQQQITAAAEAYAKRTYLAHKRGRRIKDLGVKLDVSQSWVWELVSRGKKVVRRELENDPLNELSARVRNVIGNVGAEPTPEGVARRFAQFSPRELVTIPNFGAGSWTELSDWLVRHGQRPLSIWR